MFTVFLSLHIVIALVMMVSAVFALLGAWKSDSLATKHYTRILVWGLSLELVSGSLLALLSPESTSLFEFCRNIAVYLFSVGGVLFVVFLSQERRPLSLGNLVPILPGLFVSVYTVLHLG